MQERGERVVLVTGAAGNLGRAVAQAFLAQGERVVLVDLRREALEQVAAGMPGQTLVAPADLLTREGAQAAVDAALARFGRLDVLCNIAGGFRMGEAVHETSDETWDALMGLNARTVLNTSRAAVPALLAQSRGWIVNVAAGAALRGGAQMGAYAASKSVVIRLTESLSAELRERGINVNCVLPSIIDTPENRAAMPQADPARWVAPAELAEVIRFLASPAARAVHGAAVPVSGLS
ncbi:SDR family NAD(P)-dependent oxidoreductase [Ramlibacter rhizophilus]|uniref:SDR family NAD(P)-dependent oxidoreductase n=1 Tax=Ramlibacter rhizophilus TaxID=1781167 RepID=A0A4Z0BH56_9BURK|nr:SDR family NAD(P)-dependent oxidoreductase [Ramlibacter rhizophilus]TFY98645.1 SDR family NAD(P)-dependent oxidoreductase [Ramlibacter rhizophilus]